MCPLHLVGNVSSLNDTRNGKNSSGVHLTDYFSAVTHYELLLWCSLSGFMTVLSFLCYIFLTYALYITHRRKSGACVLIAHSVFIEFQLSLIHAPLFIATVFSLHRGVKIYAEFCRYSQMMYWVTLAALNWSILTLAINRFVAVSASRYYSAFTKTRLLLSIVVVVWLIGAGCEIPAYFGPFAGRAPPVGPCTRVKIRMKSEILASLQAWLSTYFPLGAAGFLYMSICIMTLSTDLRKRLALCRSNSVVPLPLTVSPAHRRRMRITRMLFFSVLWNVACFLPGPIIRLYPRFSVTPARQLWIAMIMQCGYAFNPVRTESFVYTMQLFPWAILLDRLWRSAERSRGSLVWAASTDTRR